MKTNQQKASLQQQRDSLEGQRFILDAQIEQIDIELQAIREKEQLDLQRLARQIVKRANEERDQGVNPLLAR